MPCFFENVIIGFNSDDEPELLIRISTSLFVEVEIAPRSPWAASPADCKAKELAPIEFKDEAIKLAKWPDFPTPTKMHFDLQSPIILTASLKEFQIFFFNLLKADICRPIVLLAVFL